MRLASLDNSLAFLHFLNILFHISSVSEMDGTRDFKKKLFINNLKYIAIWQK